MIISASRRGFTHNPPLCELVSSTHRSSCLQRFCWCFNPIPPFSFSPYVIFPKLVPKPCPDSSLLDSKWYQNPLPALIKLVPFFNLVRSGFCLCWYQKGVFMLVKFDADSDFVESLKAITGHNTASKACHSAAVLFLKQVETIDDLRRTVARLRDQVLVQQEVINSARDAASLLIERTGQADLFTD